MIKGILLTHACEPKAKYLSVNESLYDLGNNRFTRGQDIFTSSFHCHMLPLHLLAQNIDIPATVLEFANFDDFKKEVSQNYEYVALNVNIVFVETIIKMCKLIREISPESKIILGGYGVVVFEEIMKKDSSLEQYVDFICKEEGVGFLRKILGEDEKRPIQQLIPTGAILSGLGCKEGCDFCQTSAFFKKQYIEVATAEEIFKFMKENFRYRRRPMYLFDENFMDFKDKVNGLGKFITGDEEFGLKYLGYSAYGSINSLEQYTTEELILTGVSSIWIGVESLYTILQKRSGDIKKTFETLNNVGIETVGSWIIGFDEQNPDNIQEDVDFYNSLCPTFTQITNLVPGPGTVLWDNYKREGRIPKDLPWRSFNGYDYSNAKNFSRDEAMNIINNTYKKLFETHGPTYMRSLRLHIKGYNYCIKSENSKIREDRSFFHKRLCKKFYSYVLACYLYAPNKNVKSLIKSIDKDYQETFGRPTIGQVLISLYFLQRFTIKKIKAWLFGKKCRTEPFRIYHYPNDESRFNGRPYRVEYPKFSWQYFLKKINPMNAIFRYIAHK